MKEAPTPPYLVHVRVGDRGPADQLVLLLEELGQLEVESCLDALDGFLVLWPAAAAFHVADDWIQRDNRRPVSPTQGRGARWGWLGLEVMAGEQEELELWSHVQDTNAAVTESALLLPSASPPQIISCSHLSPLTFQRGNVGWAGLLLRRKQQAFGPDLVMEGINRLHGNRREDLRESSHRVAENREQKPRGSAHPGPQTSCPQHKMLSNLRAQP